MSNLSKQERINENKNQNAKLDAFCKKHGEPDWSSRGTVYFDGYQTTYGWSNGLRFQAFEYFIEA